MNDTTNPTVSLPNPSDLLEQAKNVTVTKPSRNRARKLEAYRDVIQTLRQKSMPASRIAGWLNDNGVRVHLSTVRNYIAQLNGGAE